MCSLFYVLLPAITITIQIYFPHSPYIEWSQHRHGKCQNYDKYKFVTKQHKLKNTSLQCTFFKATFLYYLFDNPCYTKVNQLLTEFTPFIALKLRIYP